MCLEMVTISSFSDRTNFLNFKHSVSELPILICVALYPNDFFFPLFWRRGQKAAILCLKMILWLSCVC